MKKIVIFVMFFVTVGTQLTFSATQEVAQYQATAGFSNATGSSVSSRIYDPYCTNKLYKSSGRDTYTDVKMGVNDEKVKIHSLKKGETEYESHTCWAGKVNEASWKSVDTGDYISGKVTIY